MHARGMKTTATMTTTMLRATTTTRSPAFAAAAAAAAAAAPSPAPPPCLLSRPPPPRSSVKLPPFRASARLSRTTQKKQTPFLYSLVVAAAAAAAAAANADAAAPSSSSSTPAPPPLPRGGPPPPRPGALPFDTPLAIALAGAAFEAYNSPAGFEVDPQGRDFAFVDADGTRTHYFDPKVLAAASSGGVVAKVRVSRAAGLPASDAWGTSDPYFLAELRGRAAAHQSAVVARTCSPTFDDEFELYVGRNGTSSGDGGGGGGKEDGEDPLDAVLRISFFDSDALTSDDALGSAEISLRELVGKGGEEVELSLVAAAAEAEGANGKSAGSVFLSGSVRTLSEAELAARASGTIAPDGTDEVARMSRAWRSLAKAAAGGGADGKEGDSADSIFAPAAFIENPASDTQLWIGVDNSTRRLMIAFRGTETTKM